MYIRHTGRFIRALLACGAAGSILFVSAFLVLGLLRQEGYAVKYTVSALADGRYGHLQVISFLLSGFMYLCYAAGLQRAVVYKKGNGAIVFFVALAGCGLLGAGLFRSHMPGEATISIGAYVHYGFAMLLFIALPAACIILIRRFREEGKRRMMLYSQLSLVVVLLFFGLMVAGIADIDGFVNYTGLFQRISIGTGFAWVAVWSLSLVKKID